MHLKYDLCKYAILSIVLAMVIACQSMEQDQPAPESRTPAEVSDDPGSNLAGFGPGAPRWAITGDLPRYPSSQYIRGLGYSNPGMTELDAHSQAKLQAFKDISDQIETKISNEFTVIMREVFHNDTVDDLVDAKSISKQVTEELLPGAEVIDRYRDPATGTAANFAVMDRLKLSKRLLKNAEEARAQADGFLSGYEEEAGQNRPSAMLKNLIHAQGALDKIQNAHLKAIAVGATQEMFDRFKSLNDPALKVRITREAAALNDHIRIEPVKGNEQKALLTGQLPQAVEVRVFWDRSDGRIPVDGFPMTVNLPGEEKGTVIPAAQNTDGEGRYSFSMQELKSTGAAANIATVALDFDAVEKRSTLGAPFTEITYLMPTLDTTRIGVFIHEVIDGEENANSYVGSAVKDALTDIGFQVIRLESDRPVEEIVDWAPSQLRDRFAAQCEYLIVGTAESELSSREGRFIFYRTRLVIDALELGTGKTIHFEVPFEKTKSGQGTDKKAMRSSLNKAANILVGDPKKEKPGLLAKKFIARFEEGADWADEE